MFSNVPGGNLLNNIGGNISNLGDKVNPSGALGNIGSKLPGNLNSLNPTNIAGNFSGTTGTGEVFRYIADDRQVMCCKRV